jgi:hypothetical protein
MLAPAHQQSKAQNNKNSKAITRLEKVEKIPKNYGNLGRLSPICNGAHTLALFAADMLFEFSLPSVVSDNKTCRSTRVLVGLLE